MESLITNPGFEHLGHNILSHLDTKNLLNIRLVNHQFKDFVDNPRLWLKKLNYKNSGFMELHEAWMSLIQKVEAENSDLLKNIVLNLIKLIEDDNDLKDYIHRLSIEFTFNIWRSSPG